MFRKNLATAALVVLSLACADASSGPPLFPGSATANVTSDPALAGALATASPTALLDVIVTYNDSVTTNDAVANSLLGLGAGVIGFENLPVVAARANPAQIASMQTVSGVEGVYLNRQLQYLLAESIPAIHADAVHVAGITGKGIGVAILDSGVDGLYNQDLTYPSHTVANVKYLANLADIYTNPGSIDKSLKKGASVFVENLANTESSMGHGTHVAGIVAATGASSGGKYIGVAPGANIVGIAAGEGPAIFWALAGFDYIISHRDAYNIKVVNNSWGSDGAYDAKDPINKATKKVHDAGITVVFAAGNSGPAQNTMNPYSVAPWVISVAAGCKIGVIDPTNSAAHCVDGNGRGVIGDFSSRGVPGDPLLHPDITAPGVHVVSTRASTGTILNALDLNHDARVCNISLTNQAYYTCASGTSMASPHVTGVVALMQEAAGGKLSPDRVLAVLRASAKPLAGFGEWEAGAGYLDALAAVNCIKNNYACLK
ncbi:MAG: S8 family serine peptidase [Gemmatimonadaceae bacterium]|nr:S8 family serine peptidase [Gemmatimonadaceae bacterium]